MTEVRFLSRNDLAGLAEPDEYVEAVRDGYRQQGEQAAAKPRTKLINEAPPGMLTGYMAILPETGAMGGYMYSGGFESGDAWFFTPLFDADSGEPLALLDGVNMNPFKTGATGAVAVDALARQDSSVLGLLGSGPQAAGQLQAIATVRSLKTVKVYSPTNDHRREFAREFDAELDPTVTAVPSPDEAVSGSDIVVTATDSREPVFDSVDLDAGSHVTAMGQYDTRAREIDAETVRRSKYVLDLKDRATQDAGALIQARNEGMVDRNHIQAELGEIIAGNCPGRESPEEITLFDSGGTAIETVAAAYMLYEKARKEGRGRTIEFAPSGEALTGRLENS